MKKFLIALFLLTAVASSAAWPPRGEVSSPYGSNFGYNAITAQWYPIAVGENGALKMESVTVVGTATVSVGAPPTTLSQISVAAANEPISFENLVNRRKLLLINTSATNAIRVSLDSTLASASISFGLTIQPYGQLPLDLPSTKSVSIWASATAMVDVLQQGD